MSVGSIHLNEVADWLLPKRDVEDWSGCRSPSRAKRRHRQGHKQRMVVKKVPVVVMIDDTLFTGPGVADMMRLNVVSRMGESLKLGERRQIPIKPQARVELDVEYDETLRSQTMSFRWMV